MTTLRNSLSAVFFAVGFALLILLVRKVGVGAIADTFRRLGPNIVWILLLPVSWTWLQSLAWRRVLKDEDHDASLTHVFLAKITGEAVNTVTPLSIVGGDPYRIYMLKGKTSGGAGAASVVIDRTVHTIAIFLLLALTLALAWTRLDLPPAWRVAMPLVLAGFLGFLYALVASQKKGVFGGLSSLLRRLGLFGTHLEKWDRKLAELDAQIGAFYRKSRLHFFEILSLHFLSRVLGAVEIYLIGRLLHLPLGPLQSLFLASLTILINTVFSFIPSGMGVLEGGYGALFYLMKLDPAHGVAIQLVRRVRTFFWVFLGLLVILLYKPRDTRRKETA